MPNPFATTAAQPARASPVGRSRADKARFWDRIARRYAADPIADPAGYEATLRRVQGLLSAQDAVLEIGCGTGSTALRLAPHVRRMLATDVSSSMIDIARARLAARPLPQLAFAVADAEAPAAAPGPWDAVLAFNLLHLVDDLDRALAAVVQALAPGGLFVSKTACIAEMNPLVPRVALPLMRAIGRAPHVLCFDAAHLQAALRRHGLVVESVERHGTRGRDIRVVVVARRPPG